MRSIVYVSLFAARWFVAIGAFRSALLFRLLDDVSSWVLIGRLLCCVNFPKLGYPRSNTIMGNGLKDNFNCNDKPIYYFNINRAVTCSKDRRNN